MLASIHPLGERARHNRWTITVTAYLIASVIGGALTGSLAALVGSAVSSATGVTVPFEARGLAAVAILATITDAIARGRVPSWRRQVNEDWLNRYRGWVYGAGFGFQLGTGVLTIITTASVYA